MTHPDPVHTTVTDSRRYGRATAVAFARMHPRLGTRSGWSAHDGELPVIEGTVVGLRVECLPGDRDPKPVWLWVSKPVPDHGTEVDRWWSMYLRRFDLEHTLPIYHADPRLDQAPAPGPVVLDPAAADRWIWIILVAPDPWPGIIVCPDTNPYRRRR